MAKWGKEVYKRAKERIGHLFPKHGKREPSAYIWAWVATCERCGQQNPLVLNWRLSIRGDIGLKPILTDDFDFSVQFTSKPPNRTVSRGKSSCLRCGSPISKSIIRRSVSEGKRRLLCVVLARKGAIDYELPTEEDLEALDDAEKALREEWNRLNEMGMIPTEEIPNYELGQLTSYGFSRWYQLFSPRQLLSLLVLQEEIIKVGNLIAEDKGIDHAKAIMTYLALTLCRHAQYNALCTTWPAGAVKEAISSVLSFRRPSMTWNHAEVNPFGISSGTWINMLSGVENGLRFAISYLQGSSGIEVRLASALSLPMDNGEFDIIVTDPPYLDDVLYVELSEFYYVWLWRMLHKWYPELPGPKVPLDEELSASNLVGPDLIVAGVGKALEVLTQYKGLKTYSGEATIVKILEVVGGVAFSHSVERLVKRSIQALDPQTSFYIFAKCFFGGVIPSDDALLLCKGAGIELEALTRDGILEKQKGSIRVVEARKRGIDIDDPKPSSIIVDQLHLLELAVHIGGRNGFERVNLLPWFRAGEVRAVAEALYTDLKAIGKADDPEVKLLIPIIDLYNNR